MTPLSSFWPAPWHQLPPARPPRPAPRRASDSPQTSENDGFEVLSGLSTPTAERPLGALGDDAREVGSLCASPAPTPSPQLPSGASSPWSLCSRSSGQRSAAPSPARRPSFAGALEQASRTAWPGGAGAAMRGSPSVTGALCPATLVQHWPRWQREAMVQYAERVASFGPQGRMGTGDCSVLALAGLLQQHERAGHIDASVCGELFAAFLQHVEPHQSVYHAAHASLRLGESLGLQRYWGQLAVALLRAKSPHELHQGEAAIARLMAEYPEADPAQLAERLFKEGGAKLGYKVRRLQKRLHKQAVSPREA